MGKKTSDEQIERIRKLYEEGNAQVTIAKEMNISQSTIPQSRPFFVGKIP